MQHQFKPGDIAVIVGAERNTAYLGVGCVLVRSVAPGEIVPERGGKRFMPQPLRPCAYWIIRFDDGNLSVWPSVFLRPLGGDEDLFKREMLESSVEQVSRLAGILDG